MKVTVTEDKAWKRILEIEVPREIVDGEFESVYQKFQSQAKIPGFRPGKAPIDLVKSRFKEGIEKEVLETLLPKAFDDAVKESKLYPINLPRLKEIEFEKGAALKFKAEVEIRPEIEPKDYKGLELTKRIYPTTEKEVQKALELLQERMAELKSVEREARDGDFLIVDLVKLFDKNQKLKEEKVENYQLQLGAKTIFQEVESQLVGSKTGEEKEIEINYPKDYFVKELADNTVKYRIKVKEIKEKLLAEIDDQFAKSVDGSKDLKELQEKVKKDLIEQSEKDSQEELKNGLVKKVVENNQFEVPSSMLETYLNSVVEDFKKRYKDAEEEKIREGYKEIGTNQIRWIILFHDIAKNEKIEVTAEDVDNWTEKFAKAYNQTIDKAREILAQSKKIQDLKETILEEKVLDFLLSQSQIKEEIVQEEKSAGVEK